jgi:phosphate/sulfate permease
MSEQEQKPTSDMKTVNRVIFWIGMLALVAGIVTNGFLRDYPIWLRIIVTFAVGLGAYFGASGVARICGVGPFGGIDPVRCDPATGRRLTPDETSR